MHLLCCPRNVGTLPRSLPLKSARMQRELDVEESDAILLDQSARLLRDARLGFLRRETDAVRLVRVRVRSENAEGFAEGVERFLVMRENDEVLDAIEFLR